MLSNTSFKLRKHLHRLSGLLVACAVLSPTVCAPLYALVPRAARQQVQLSAVIPNQLFSNTLGFGEHSISLVPLTGHPTTQALQFSLAINPTVVQPHTLIYTGALSASSTLEDKGTHYVLNHGDATFSLPIHTKNNTLPSVTLDTISL